jgi:phosphotriesterase-related protein
MHIEAAQKGSWVSFDGINPKNIEAYAGYLQTMLRENLIDNVLISQDAGWYHIGEPKGGDYRNHNCIFDDFIPYLKQNGFKQTDIDKVFVSNPAKAFSIKVRKL